MAVKIANAVRNENGGIAGGEVGDQDKLEVRVQKFYVKGSVEERIMEVVKQRQVGSLFLLPMPITTACTS